VPQATQPQAAVTPQQAAQQFERYAQNAQRVIAGRALWWESIYNAASAAGLAPAQYAPELVEANRRADQAGIKWQRMINALTNGTAIVQPYQIGNGPIKLGVKQTQGRALGWFGVALQVARYAAGAVLTGASWLSLDAWQETQQTEAIARRTDAETRSTIAQLAKADPSLAAPLIQAMREADHKAANAGPDWIDRFGTAAAAATGGIAVSGAMMALAFWYLTRNKRKKNPPRRRRRR
jgi:hypothetical protein